MLALEILIKYSHVIYAWQHLLRTVQLYVDYKMKFEGPVFTSCYFILKTLGGSGRHVKTGVGEKKENL